MILAIGNSGVYEFNAFRSVVEELVILGENAILFKQDKCLEGEYLAFGVAGGRSYYNIVVDGREYSIDDFSAIWYMKPHLPIELMEFESAEYRHFIHRQFLAMRTAIWSVFSNKKWIDDPWKIQKAEDKIFQIHLAEVAGFEIPDTLVTSDPERIKFFYERCGGNMIVKILSTSPMVGRVVYTNRVTPENLSLIESVRSSPSIFQACIEKKYELRITVVGDKIFPVKIHSQGDKLSALDWRRKPLLNDFEVKMEATVLPLQFEDMIRRYMKLLGLRFGCIDVIVTPEDRYIFLEINPNGQWYFVQLNTGEKIAKEIARLLV